MEKWNFPPATSTSWSIEFVSEISSNSSSRLLSGTLGLSGDTYQLDMDDILNEVQASFILKDTFATVLEGASGADAFGSNEYAMPSLSIQEGSKITLAGVATQLGSGSL